MPYILIIFQEYMKVAIFSENRVRRESLKKDFMGGHSLLKDSEIFTKREAFSWHHSLLYPVITVLLMPLSKIPEHDLYILVLLYNHLSNKVAVILESVECAKRESGIITG